MAATRKSSSPRRDRVLTKLQKTKDMLLTAQHTIPTLVSEVDDVMKEIEDTPAKAGGEENPA